MAHWLFLPDDAVDDLAILAGLDAARLKQLRDHLDSMEPKSRYTFFVRVAEALGISDDAAAGLVAFINHVHNQSKRLKKGPELVPGELESFLQRLPASKKAPAEVQQLLHFVRSNRASIVNLFAQLPNRDLSNKVRGLETNPAPSLHAFRTFCDLRPVYNDDATEIVAQVPVLTLSLTTHSNATDKYEQTIASLTENDVAELRKGFERLEKKLALIKKQNLATEKPNGEGGP